MTRLNLIVGHPEPTLRGTVLVELDPDQAEAIADALEKQNPNDAVIGDWRTAAREAVRLSMDS